MGQDETHGQIGDLLTAHHIADIVFIEIIRFTGQISCNITLEVGEVNSTDKAS
jgi:hypothetical protein